MQRTTLSEADAAALAAAAPLNQAEAEAALALALADADYADADEAAALADTLADAADAEADTRGGPLGRFDRGLRRILAEAALVGWGPIAARMDAALAANPTLAAGPTLAECVGQGAADAADADEGGAA